MGTFANYVGTINIPEDKKQEFNENMIKLLGFGGMMQFDQVSLYGKKIDLIHPVEFNEEGECWFHYNYFEDDAWETAVFYSDGNILRTDKIGSDEFCDVICAAYFLTEVYSDSYGYVDLNGDIVNLPCCVQWINFILDKDFSLSKRFDLWEYYERYCIAKIENGYRTSELDPNIVFDIVPKGFEAYMGGAELADIMYIIYGTDTGMEDVKEGSYVAEILQIKNMLKEYYENHPENGYDEVKALLKIPRAEREQIKGTDYDDLAKLSLRIPARVFIYLSAELLGLDFWDEWINIYHSTYKDEEMISYVSKGIDEKRRKVRYGSLGKIKTSEFLKNDGPFTFWRTPDELKYKDNYYISDDDLMYWWDGSDKYELSDKMLEKIEKWKQIYQEILVGITKENANEFEMLKQLMSDLHEANGFYKRIYAFNSMFYEFLEHAKNPNYIAAVKLFEKVIEDNKTAGKIIEKVGVNWDTSSKNIKCNEGRINIKRFLSLMANQELRKIYFGF